MTHKMASEISILRKYLSIIYLRKPRRTFTFKVGIYNDSNIYPWGDMCLETDSESFIDVFKTEGSKITDYDNIFILDENDIQEFLETDDLSLILRYGRKITDNNIIQSLNKKLDYMNNDIKLEDFDKFLDIKI